MPKSRLWSYLLIFLPGLALGQLNTDADFKRQVYDRAYVGGIGFHTRGYALHGRYLKYKDGYTTQGFEFDLVKLRHPKEVISSEDIFNSYRGYVRGRTNSLYTMRMGYVQERILFDKTDQGSISIAWVYSGGLSLGLLKPIYLVVDEISSEGTPTTEIIRYTGETNPFAIRGEANFFTGINETALRPGIYAKTGFSFDFQLLDDQITTLETGVAYDYFFTEVPIFYEANEDINWSGFFQLYLAVNFGYKLN